MFTAACAPSHDRLCVEVMQCVWRTWSAACRPDWSPEQRLQMRKLDHASIFLLIAGEPLPAPASRTRMPQITLGTGCCRLLLTI